MKLMFASDIHGSAYYCEKLMKCLDQEAPEKMVLLGDLLYHGPRNDLPKEYNPKEVIRMLNEKKDVLLCVRGNCEAEVDQMVLEFPVMSDSMILFVDGITIFATHGHLYHENNLPQISDKDVLVHGHTHVQAIRKMKRGTYLNPGSVSIPKEGNQNSYMIYDNGCFIIKSLDGEEIKKWIYEG